MTGRESSWTGWVATSVVAVVVAAFLIATPTWWGTGSPTGAGASRELMVASGVVSTTAVVLARRWPLAATVLALLPFAAVPWIASFVWGWLLGLLGVMVVAAAHRWRAAIPAWVAAAAVVGVYCSGGYPAILPIGPVTSGGEYGFSTLVFAMYLVWHTAALIVAAALGNAARSRERRLAAEAKERHAFEVENVASERARMARDLHDVVAHHVSLIAVRAESAPYQHPHLDPDSRTVLAAIAADARVAMNELRHALTVLRRADGQDDAADAEERRRPQPAAEDVPGLVDQARSAGQSVQTTGHWPGEVPSTQGYVLYRAVQEGLTNARRHAPGSPVTVVFERDQGKVGFTMTNPTTAEVTSHPPGRGLLGMRERVVAVGGSVEAGGEAGLFTLRVELPEESRP